MDNEQLIKNCKAEVEAAIKKTGAFDRVMLFKQQIEGVRAMAADPDDGQAALMLAYFDMMLEPDML